MAHVGEHEEPRTGDRRRRRRAARRCDEKILEPVDHQGGHRDLAKAGGAVEEGEALFAELAALCADDAVSRDDYCSNGIWDTSGLLSDLGLYREQAVSAD